MLWTDANFITAADLATVDPDVSATAAAQGIDVSAAIQRGIEDAGRILEGWMISFTTYVNSTDLSANHLSAVFYTGTQPTQRRRVSLEQVVVSGRNENYWSEIKRWAVNHVLLHFYSAASSKAENDRYEDKARRHRTLDQMYLSPELRRSGIPIVYRALECPAAAQSLAGNQSWAASATARVGATDVGARDVAITYVDQSFYVSPAKKQNGESNVSARKSVTLAADQAIRVDISGLVPPDGSIAPAQLARGFSSSMKATGWNVYVGAAGGKLVLQNEQPIPIATKTFTMSTNIATSGVVADQGQVPSAFLTISTLTQRA